MGPPTRKESSVSLNGFEINENSRSAEGKDISTYATLIRTGSSVFFSPASHDTSRQLKNMYIENLVVVILSLISYIINDAKIMEKGKNVRL